MEFVRKGGVAVEVEAKILLRSCNPLDGRSGWAALTKQLVMDFK